MRLQVTSRHRTSCSRIDPFKHCIRTWKHAFEQTTACLTQSFLTSIFSSFFGFLCYKFKSSERNITVTAALVYYKFFLVFKIVWRDYFQKLLLQLLRSVLKIKLAACAYRFSVLPLTWEIVRSQPRVVLKSASCCVQFASSNFFLFFLSFSIYVPYTAT